jgi:hypothetical protein
MFLKKNCAKNVNMGVSEHMRVLEMFFLVAGRSKWHMSPNKQKKTLGCTTTNLYQSQ